MTKRNLWSYEETLALIQIIEEKKCLQKIEEKLLHPNEVYEVVQNEMFSRGYYDKNSKQMRFRWQNLRKTYYRDRKIMEKGLDKGHKKSPYYDILDTMLTARWEKRREENIANSLCEDGLISGNPIDEENMTQNSSDEEGMPIAKIEMPTFEECFPTLPSTPRPRVSLKRPPTQDSTVDKFHEKIKKVSKELNEDLFRKQKELIEYEFRLFANFSTGRDDKFKELMATNTQTFLNGIKDLLQDKTQPSKLTRPKSERKLDEDDRTITQFFETWDNDKK